MIDWLIIGISLSVDALLGEVSRFHPLVGFGHVANYLDKRFNVQTVARSDTVASQLNAQDRFRQRSLGLFALVCALAIPTAGLVFLLLWSPEGLYPLIAIVILYLCIGRKSLFDHAKAIYAPLDAYEKTGDESYLKEAREKVGWIVSRDTAQMSPEQIRIATIESVLENGNDSLFGVLFWFLLAGPVGALVYRLVNTLDAMWGYKTPQYLYFGWAAAKLDDLMNWPSARLTALGLALAGNTRLALRCWRSQARSCESPNGGPVMTAGAGSLGIRLGGTTQYHGKTKQKPPMGLGCPPSTDDIKAAMRLVDRCLCYWLVTLLGIWLFRLC